MKMIAVVTLALVACVAAAPPATGDQVQVLSEFNEQQPDGQFKNKLVLNNGIEQESVGELKTVIDEENKPHSVIVIRGSYKQLDAAGQQQTITYVADEAGYRPDGPAVPKAPARR